MTNAKPVPQMVNKYFIGYPATKDTIKTIKNKSAAVERFEGKINKTTMNIGSHNSINELLKEIFLSLCFEKYRAVYIIAITDAKVEV